MKREILQYPDERLRLISKEVEEITEETQILIDDMIETMIAANGIGLAAPQIGEQKRIIVIARSIIEAIENIHDDAIEYTDDATNTESDIDIEKEDEAEALECLILINPTIQCSGTIITYQEGCLSVPEYRESVERYSNVLLHALDKDGKPYTLEAEGLLAVCIQHELDHLEGKLFIDKLSFLKRSLYEKKIMKKQRERH